MSIIPALLLSFPSQKRFCFVCLKHFLRGRRGPYFSKTAVTAEQLLAFVSRDFVTSSSWTQLSFPKTEHSCLFHPCGHCYPVFVSSGVRLRLCWPEGASDGDPAEPGCPGQSPGTDPVSYCLLAGGGRGLLYHLWCFLPHPLRFAWFYKRAAEGGVGRNHTTTTSFPGPLLTLTLSTQLCCSKRKRRTLIFWKGLCHNHLQQQQTSGLLQPPPSSVSQLTSQPAWLVSQIEPPPNTPKPMECIEPISQAGLPWQQHGPHDLPPSASGSWWLHSAPLPAPGLCHQGMADLRPATKEQPPRGSHQVLLQLAHEGTGGLVRA